MSFRQYDPAIARFTSIDPVTHYSMSTYTAFDNNPVFWADPSGADGEHYDWDKETYVNDKGEEVSFATAMASVGLNTDGSQKENDENDDSNGISLPESNNVELSSNSGCQDGGCYDPIDFKKDSPETIYKKLINNFSTFVKEKNEAIRTGNPMIAVYIEELIRLDNIYGEIHKSSGDIIDRTINYNGGTIEIVALPLSNDPIVGYRFKGAKKRMEGSSFYYSFEARLMGGHRNKVKGNDHTGFSPKMLNLRFSSKEQYDSFVREVKKSMN